MLKLYSVPKTRSLRPRWLLEELGVPYELIVLGPPDTKRPEYLAINPLGHVPALDDDGTPLFESAALCMHLADKFPDKQLAPPPGSKERGRYYQWIVFAQATLEPHVAAVGEQHRLFPDEAQRDKAVIERAKKRFTEVAVLEKELQGREFLVGEHFTAADVVVAAILGWARSLGMLDEYPSCSDYAKRMMARPAAKKAREA